VNILAAWPAKAQVVDGVELGLGHVHVVPERLRHRGDRQIRAPDLVAGSVESALVTSGYATILLRRRHVRRGSWRQQADGARRVGTDRRPAARWTRGSSTTQATT
jgi:hypothetical protein